MTSPQYAAFLVWWKTGLEGSGKRSLRKAAKILGKSLQTLVDWHEEQDWEKLAAEKDRELQAEMEQVVFDQVLSVEREVIERQRKLIAVFYGLVMKGLKKIGEDMTFDKALRLMEYERSLSADPSGKGTGIALQQIFQFLPPEARGAIHRAASEARDRGLDLLRDGVGSPGRN